MHHVEQRGDEHEGELQRLGHSGEEGSQSAGGHEGADDLALALIRAQVHGECRTRQTEHHDREEARLVAAHDALDRALAVGPNTRAISGRGRGRGGVDGGLAGLEVTDVVDTDDVEPEDGVQCVVQASRDEQAVGHAVDAGTRRAQALDGGTEVEQRVVDERPHKVEDPGDNHGEDRGKDRHQSAAREEGEEVRQLSAVETVIYPGRHDAGEDAEEDVAAAHSIPAFRGPFQRLIAGQRGGVFDAAVAGHGLRAEQFHKRGEGQETR